MSEQLINAFDKIDFFKFKEIFYTNDTLWKQLTDNQKSQHYWMMQRNIAIAYPTIMQHFNVIGMNPISTLNACHTFLLSDRQPRWSFISGKKDKQLQIAEEDSIAIAIAKFDDWIVNEFCKAYDIDKKTFNDYCNFHKEEALEALRQLAVQLSGEDKSKQ